MQHINDRYRFAKGERKAYVFENLKKNYQLNTYDIILKIYRNKQMKFRNRFVNERTDIDTGNQM